MRAGNHDELIAKLAEAEKEAEAEAMRMRGWLEAMIWIDSPGLGDDQMQAYKLCLAGEKEFGFEAFTKLRKAMRGSVEVSRSAVEDEAKT